MAHMAWGAALLPLTMMALACSNDSSSADSGDGGGGDESGGSSSGSGGASGGQSSGTGGGTSTGDGGTNGGDGGSNAGTGGGSSPGGRPNVPPGTGTASAREFAQKLGRDHFLIGMGNDLAPDHNEDGAYTLGVTLDLHYAYLVGLLGQGGWPDWNPGGYFVDILAEPALARGVVPMYTLYSMAARGEAQLGVLTDDSYMRPYWDGAKLLYERLGEIDEPAVVHLEPDFWAFTQQQSGGNPASVPVHVGSLAPDCAGQPDNLVGMGRCLVALARRYAPKTLVGFHASVWAAGDPESIAEYLTQIGGDTADFVATDMLDRDAGCFEAGVDPACQRGGEFYWDETNQTSPNFHEHLDWAERVADTLGKPMMWWQVPFGVPSDTPGGTAGNYRDNRVKYIFEHTDEFVAAGGVGACFGTGAANQTYITTDGGQFRNAVTAYYESPTPL